MFVRRQTQEKKLSRSNLTKERRYVAMRYPRTFITLYKPRGWTIVLHFLRDFSPVRIRSNNLSRVGRNAVVTVEANFPLEFSALFFQWFFPFDWNFVSRSCTIDFQRNNAENCFRSTSVIATAVRSKNFARSWQCKVDFQYFSARQNV